MKRKIVIIGLQNNGKSHLNELRRCDHFDLVAVSDKIEKKDFGRIKSYDDEEEMLSNTQPEAILVTDDGAERRDMVLKCVKFSKNILLQSPFATSLEEARTLKYVIQTNHAKVMIGYESRYNPVIVSLVRELKKDKKIYSINLNFGDKEADLTKMAIKNVDLFYYLSNDENLATIKREEMKENGKIWAISYVFKGKNNILANINIQDNHPVQRWKIEICTDTGLYVGNLITFELYKITPTGRLNLKVDKDNYSLRAMYREFAEFLDDEKAQNETIENAIKIWETLK